VPIAEPAPKPIPVAEPAPKPVPVAVPVAKSVPVASPAAPPAAPSTTPNGEVSAPALTRAATADAVQSPKEDIPKDAKVELQTSLLDKFIADETWEQNATLKKLAPYLQAAERAMMLFGSSALAWIVGRTGFSFGWILLIFLSMTPAWDRSLKTGFQRMKALARSEILNSRVSGTVSRD
jgi:Ca2+-dependent lipid-binding protein